MTEPAIRAVKQRYPQASLSILTSHSGSLIAPYISSIDHVHICDVPWAKHGANTQSSQQVSHLISQLKDEQYDCAILCTTFSQNPLPAAMVCYLAEIPRVVGYCRENPYNLITDWVPDPEPLDCVRHEVERQIGLLGAIDMTNVGDTSFQLSIPDQCYERVSSVLSQHGISRDTRYICLHVGVSEKRRAFPVEVYIAAAQKLAARGYSILCTGSTAEQELATRTAHSIGKGAHSFAGKLSIGELAALLNGSTLLIGNNTGPVHIAAAMQTPVVVLYAQTNPQHTPWKVRHRVLYFDVPEHNRSKNKILEYISQPYLGNMISAEEIVSAAETLL